MKIIGVAGPARSGKDEIGHYLINEYGFKSASFAAPLKRMVAAMLGRSIEWVDEHKDEPLWNLNTSPRHLLQTLGTEWGRQLISQNLWISFVQEQIEAIVERIPDTPGVVITDVRFDNEAEWIRGNGGIICHVQRPEAPSVRIHQSEAGVTADGSDFRTINDSALSTLHGNIDIMLDMYPTLLRLRR